VGRWIVKPLAPVEQSPAPAERWATRCLEGESPNRSYTLNGGPPDARSILIVSRQRAQGRCFSDLRHSEAWESFSRIELVMKNDLVPWRGYCWGSLLRRRRSYKKKHLRKIDTKPKLPIRRLRSQRHRLKDEMTNRPMIICIMIVDLL
jgi:hypothetical protein